MHDEPHAAPSAHKHKVVVIGLDACDPDLLQRWSRKGRLPFPTSLMESGTWARLLSTDPVPGVDGLQVRSWGEHYPLLERSSLPPELGREVSARFGSYRHPDEVIDPSRSQEVRLYRTMLANVQQKLTELLKDELTQSHQPTYENRPFIVPEEMRV